MRNSKKLLALALAAVLALGTATTAFAADEGKDSEGETTAPTETTTPAEEDKKDDTTPAEGEDKKDDADAKDEDKKDDADAKDEDKKDDATPAEGEDKKDDTTPAEGEDKKDDATPAEGEDEKDDAPAAAVTYTDVGERWFAGAVAFVTEKKLMDGLTETTFGPDENMTRQMLAVALYRLAGSPEVTAENPFTDVAADAAYKDAVVWAYSVGVVNGVTETTFNPDGNIQRQAIAAMLARYLGVDAEEGDVSAFTDADAIQDYAKAAMSWAAKNELLKGDTKGAVDPRGNATRAQVATILERFAPMAEGKAPAAAPADDAAAPAGDDAAPADDAAAPADTDKKDDADKADDAKKDDAADKADNADKKDDAADKADDADKTEGDKADDSADKE